MPFYGFHFLQGDLYLLAITYPWGLPASLKTVPYKGHRDVVRVLKQRTEMSGRLVFAQDKLEHLLGVATTVV